MKWTFSIIVLSFILSCSQSNNKQSSKRAVNNSLNDWHNAAAETNFERYFNHFTGDSAVYMGTASTERWTVAEFKPWAKPYFDRGKAWNFEAEERHVQFSDNGKIAWFDESLDTPNLGPARGSGVLVLQQGKWKIAHYNLSIPIPNAIADTVVQQVKESVEQSTE